MINKSISLNKCLIDRNLFYLILSYIVIANIIIWVCYLIVVDLKSIKRLLIIIMYLGLLFTLYRQELWGKIFILIYLGAIINYIKRISYIEGSDRIVIYGILLLFDFVLVLIFIELVHSKKIHIKNDLLDISIILYLIISFGQIFNSSTELIANIVGFKMVAFYICAYYIGKSINLSESKILKFVKVTKNVAFLLAIYGIYQHFGGMTRFEEAWAKDPLTTSSLFLSPTEENKIFRIFSTMEGPHQLGVFLGLSTLFYFIKTKSNNTWKYFQFIIIVIALYFTYVKAAWAMALMGLSLLYLLKNVKVAKNPLSWFNIGLKILIVSIMLIIIQLYIIRIVADFTESHALKERSEISTLLGRFSSWKIYVSFGLDNPLGLGTGAVGTAGAKFRSNTLIGITPVVDNYLLQIGINLGIIGLLTFLIILLLGINDSIRSLRYLRSNLAKKLAIIILINLIVMLFALTSANYLDTPFIAFYFWFLLGLMKNKLLCRL